MRLLAGDAEEWGRVHGHSIWSGLPGFNGWRVYIDLLHVLDLACTVDAISSFLVWHTQDGQRRDTQLAQLRRQYTAWCQDRKVPHSARATAKMWSSKILMPSAGEYPTLSQKFLKGVAARIMVYWVCEIAYMRAMATQDPLAQQLSFCKKHTDEQQ